MNKNEGTSGKAARKMKLVLAYDGSEHAIAAIDLISDLPLREPYVTLMAVLRTQHIQDHENMQEELNNIRERLKARGMQVDTVLKVGNPAATINSHAQEIQADLILMGAKGLRATLGIFLGGVAQQVVEYSSCPVLVVRTPYRGLKRILVAIDGSIYSHKAMDYMAPLCEKDARQRCSWLPEDIDLTLMHVLPPPIPPDLPARAWAVGPEVIYPAPAPPIDTEKIEKEEENQGKNILEQAASLFKSAEIKSKSSMPRGDAATEILDYAKEKQIDLIVCGSRGLSEITGWLLGSVSRKLVHYAGCSVLIVK